MPRPLRALIVADHSIAKTILGELERGGFQVVSHRIEKSQDLSPALAGEEWDVIVADAGLAKPPGPNLLGLLRGREIEVPVILLCGSEDEAPGAIEAGAADCLIRDRLARLAPVVKRELARRDGSDRFREFEQAFKELAENVPQCFWLADPDQGKLIYASGACESIWSRKAQDLRKDPGAWAEAVHPEDRQRFEDLLSAGAAEGRFDSEYRLIRPDGSVRWVRDRRLLLSGRGGQVRRIAGIVEDVSERKLSADREQVLVREQEARARAEAAIRAKDSFLGVLSHELLAPLGPLLTAADLLMKSGDSSSELQRVAGLMRRNIEQELRLVNDLLDLTRITAGKLELNWSTCDVHALLERARQSLEEEIRARRLQVDLRLSAGAQFVRGDPARLLHVFWNLLGSAAKLSPAGSTIRISTQNERSGAVALEISGWGSGLDDGELRRLLRALDEEEGTLSFGELGLGLSVSRALIDLHGGTLRAHLQAESRGATFRLDLATVASEARESAPAEPAARHPATILLVENNEDTLWALARLLKRFGHEVLTASSASSALALASEHEFDLLISDIGLPDKSGWELMDELRSSRPVRGIALSGFSSEEDVQKSTQRGFTAHLTKPVEIQRLEAVIQEALL